MDRRYPEQSSRDLRSTLEAWLDYEREGVVAKARGLTDESGALSPVVSGTSPTGLLRHLALVEDYWFEAALGGIGELPGDEVFDECWATTPHTSLQGALDDYEAACARSRTVQSKVPAMDQPAAIERLARFDYGWILTHMIEETARHLGHMDILRELSDGTIGQ